MKSFITYIVLITALCSMAFGYAEKNPVLYAPQISPITVDGSFSDWTTASAWATFGKWYPNGTGLTSTTRARYAWSSTRLYINIESTEGTGLKLDVGGLYGTLPYNRDTSLNAEVSVPVTQIQFSGWSGGTATSIINQVGGTVSGVQVAYTYDGTTMRIELSLPIYADWDGSGEMTLNNSLDVYMYVNVANAASSHADSQVANGSYMYLAGGSVVNRGTLVRLRSQAKPVNCDDVPYFGKDVADFDGNCQVNFSDFAALAASWMQNTDPDATGRIAYVDSYGAVGNGTNDDTAAFQSAARAVELSGGAIVLGRNKVYCVGKQTHTEGVYPYYKYQNIIKIDSVRGKKISIIGNGATLKLNDGMRFGSFDKSTGEVYNPTLPFTDYDYNVGVGNIIQIRNCDDVEIKDVTIDGNIDGIELGGLWGDQGRQCIGSGIDLYTNAKVNISNVYTHHNPLDGVIVGWTGAVAGGATTPHVLNGVESYYNARQGLSWVGGIGLTAINSKFSHTGRERFSSSPAAGVDLEAEAGVVRNGQFTNCQFVNNVGVGVVADSGDVANVQFTNCLIWGTTNWSIWPRKPGLKFTNCDIYGAVVNTYGSATASDATQFTTCRFEDVQGREFGTYSSAALLECWGQNVKFDGCTITANQKRALYIDDAPSQEIFTNCDVYHKYAGLESGGFQSLLRGSSLTNTRFHEASLINSHYIAVGSVTVGSGVTVDGPKCKWQSTSGLTGTIPAGGY